MAQPGDLSGNPGDDEYASGPFDDGSINPAPGLSFGEISDILERIMHSDPDNVPEPQQSMLTDDQLIADATQSPHFPVLDHEMVEFTLDDPLSLPSRHFEQLANEDDILEGIERFGSNRMTEEELEQSHQELERSRSQVSSQRASPLFNHSKALYGTSPARSSGGKQRRRPSSGAKARLTDLGMTSAPPQRAERQEVADILGMPLRIEMNSDRTHTVDQVATPEGLVTMLRLTRKNETTRNTVLCCRLPIKPLQGARIARIDLIEGEMVVSQPLINIEMPFHESKDPSLFWAKLDVFIFNSSSRGGKCFWQTQRRKTLFLFYSGSLWGVPVYIVPRGLSASSVLTL
jgi:hypothetical protein